MPIIISGRHVELSEQLKMHIQDRLQNILDLKNLKVSSIRVVLEQEKSRVKAEIIVSFKGHEVTAKTEEYDMNEAIDTAIDKIQTQIRKYLDRVQDHRAQPLADAAAIIEEEGDEDDDAFN